MTSDGNETLADNFVKNQIEGNVRIIGFTEIPGFDDIILIGC